MCVELESYHTPPREALQQLKPMISPATISKNELNDAALTLKWLSEGWNTGDCKARPCSKGRRLSGSPRASGSNKKVKAAKSKSKLEPNTFSGGKMFDDISQHQKASLMEERTPVNDTKVAMMEPLSKSGEPLVQLKSKRAASQKCVAMLKEALFEETMERAEKKDFSIPKVSAQKLTKQKKAPAAGGDTARKRSRNYSERSRVGRAVQAIYQYIIKHQPAYLKKGARGVPERVIRVEYGNNPDTSKALRYLVTENRITREGIGGRKDPFSYTVKPVSPQAFISQSQSPLLVSLGVPPANLSASPHQTGPSEQTNAAVVASLAEPSITNVFSPPGDEERSTIKSRKTVQPRLSFGEPLMTSSGIKFDQALKSIGPSTVNYASPLPQLDQNNVIRSTLIENGGMPQDTFQDISGKQIVMTPSMQSAYLMQMQAAQILWNRTIMSLNASAQNGSSNKAAVANADQDSQY